MLDMDNLPPRLRRSDAVEYLRRRHGIQTTLGTMAFWACAGGGPSFQKDGQRPLYPIDELDRWAASRLSRLVSSTAELAATA